MSQRRTGRVADRKENIMLDLETLDTKTTGIILSIGAVFFDEDGMGVEFYRTVDAQSAIDAGLTMSGSTFLWWMKQAKEARRALFMNNVPLREALEDFAAWVAANAPEQVKVWGNGADFDNAMLQHAYTKLGMGIPWKFWNNRCYRTVCDILNSPPRKQEGVHHNALDDAKSQSAHLMETLTMRGAW